MVDRHMTCDKCALHEVSVNHECKPRPSASTNNISSTASAMTHAELTDRLAEVERERKELAAMVGRLREDVYAMADRIHGEWGSFDSIDDFLPDSYKETPRNALSEIRAEAVEAAASAMPDSKRPVQIVKTKQALLRHAQQIREGRA